MSRTRSGAARLEASLKAWRAEWPPESTGRTMPRRLALEILAAMESAPGSDAATAHGLLDLTASPAFLRGLGEAALRERWAEAAFRLIRESDYGLRELFESRARAHPERTLFRDMSGTGAASLTYGQTARYVRDIAGALLSLADDPGREPRVAIYAENSLDGACADLACLSHGILDAPLNPHFDPADLAEIFDALDISIALTDHPERRRRLAEAARRTARPFRMVALDPAAADRGAGDAVLGECIRSRSIRETDARLSALRRPALNEVATVMFTSGSTGRPKGVSFSAYNLVTKRFARGAALPGVGEDEVLLSFLPLYHTFGRFFELLGAIYWRGAYVFAGNPSAETLFSLFPRVQPTGFVSVPVRWTQLHERCLERLDQAGPGTDVRAVARGVVGARLRWGISAAGYLSPAVFRFFERAGVDLVSGFGMTEAAGGVTMTPPGAYRDDTQGVPLPGVRVRLDANGELQAGGHYIGRYLEDAGPGGVIPYPSGTDADFTLSTGDVFQRTGEGYYRIVDRIKDIYKNDRGQTVVPRKVEDRFAGVPGIKRTFLVGDGRPHNILFIVPDPGDVLTARLDGEEAREYFRSIVSAANLRLAPYERVVNFEILERDFERGELTPKGSYNRRRIAEGFADRIESLYRKPYVELPGEGAPVRIPRWFFRDLGILEDEIVREPGGLVDRGRGLRLRLRPAGAGGRAWLVGDLEYELQGGVIDLGVLARQPLLWVANPAFIRFAPCRDGWDAPLDPWTERVTLPAGRTRTACAADVPAPERIKDAGLPDLNRLLVRVLFAGREGLDDALEGLQRSFEEPDFRTTELIRNRLRALARHPREKVRCWAYRLLLFDRPAIDYTKTLPAFVDSGLTFLNEETIEAIGQSRLGQGRFDALRRRMAAYRETLPWPAADVPRRQFGRFLRLFVEIGRRRPVYLRGARAELSTWAMHTADPRLAALARRLLRRLHGDGAPAARPVPPDRLTAGGEVSRVEAARIRALLLETDFLRESVRMAYGDDFDPAGLPAGAIWVSTLRDLGPRPTYRVSVAAPSGRQYDLKLVLGRGRIAGRTLETLLWEAALADPPAGRPALPALGAVRVESGAVSWRYVGHLTVWERIRGYAARRGPDDPAPSPEMWRRLFVEALSAVFRAWRLSGRRIVPGRISPDDVVVAEHEFVDETVLTTLEGRRPYENTLSLVRPIVDNFYRRTAAHYPWCRGCLDPEWIFEACYDGLGREGAARFLAALERDLDAVGPLDEPYGGELRRALAVFREEFERGFPIPFPARNAARAFQQWDMANPLAGPAERERRVLELFRQYGLDRFPEIVRYDFYRRTYFAGRSSRLEALFDRLLETLGEDPARPAIRLAELSDLQAALHEEADRAVFSRLVFPRLAPDSRLDIVQEGEAGAKRVVVRSRLTDRRGEAYDFHPAVDPAEIGELYRMFYKENYPKAISPQDLHFIARDAQGRVVGGLSHRPISQNVRYIDAVVVTSRLKSVGLGAAMIDDFCGRMASEGVTIVLTHPYLPGFFIRRGFKLDRRWGALVKYL